MSANPGTTIMKRIDRSKLLDATRAVLLLGVVSAVVVLFARSVEYRWQWYRVGKYLVDRSTGAARPGLLLRGLAVTIRISAVSLVLASVFGLLTAVARLSRSVTATAVARIYLESVRNTPLLIQLFFVYFVVAPIFALAPFTSAVLALSLFEGAYTSEIIRGAIVAVRRGQWEAAYALGLSSFDTYRLIILPQALREIIPPLTSQAISLVKDSALVSTIAIYDLTMQGNAIVSETFLTFEIWFVVAAIYLVVTGSLSMIVRLVERAGTKGS
jgi:polar amino acid transport system permease protein